MRWAIVADDLTGAADAAVNFADEGVETKVWLAVGKLPKSGCVAVDADARWRDADTSSELVRKHVSALACSDWLTLKIDSTLRGFVGAMVQSAWKASGRRWVLFVPAVPKQGRIVRDGQLLVHGKPVHETDLATEKPIPIKSASVIERLRETGFPDEQLRLVPLTKVRRKAILVKEFEQAMKDGACLVCDAETDGDLSHIMSATVEVCFPPLLVGASGLAKALAKTTTKKCRQKRLTLPFRPKRLIVIVGSQQTLAQRQLEFLEAKGVSVVEANFQDLPDLPDKPVLAVRVKISEKANEESIAWMRRKLKKRLGKWLAVKPRDAFIVVGGLTSRTVLEALGVKRWKLIGSLLPGMPFGLVRFQNQPILVVTKAGGFGDEQTLWLAVRKLTLPSQSRV